ncbi:MAG TPA: hydroxyethylthiazole kinase [Methanocella sp.]|nr:hydroxyethylthiazole kinase [Methanocella sp.]
MDMKSLSSLLTQVRTKRPLVHHITNYVTVNDCANVTLCIGGAPVMAHSPEDASEMVAMANALVLNIGTPDHAQIESMLVAGSRANDLNIPIILDPVGAGATRMRTDAACTLLHKLNISVVKGNAGEIAILAGGKGTVRGVDSHGIKGDPIEIAKKLANKLDLVVAISGQTDIVTNGELTLLVDNGHPMMGKLSGTGCMASSIAGAFAGVSKDHVKSTAAALAAFGVAGEKAALHSNGPSSFKVALTDNVYRLTEDMLRKSINVRTV